MVSAIHALVCIRSVRVSRGIRCQLFMHLCVYVLLQFHEALQSELFLEGTSSSSSIFALCFEEEQWVCSASLLSAVYWQAPRVGVCCVLTGATSQCVLCTDWSHESVCAVYWEEPRVSVCSVLLTGATSQCVQCTFDRSHESVCAVSVWRQIVARPWR